MSNNNIIISAVAQQTFEDRVMRAPADWTRFPDRGIIILLEVYNNNRTAGIINVEH
jgi:hypothetical protein